MAAPSSRRAGLVLTEPFKPSIVISVDFGMTCTAVAYSLAPEWGEPRCIQRWPGRLHTSALADKVPTKVGYNEQNVLRCWGLQCKLSRTERLAIEDEFKLYLDPSFLDDFPGRPDHEQAVTYYKDYMRSLYAYLDGFFEQSIPNWSQKNVEYLFSIPTTWKNPQLVANLELWLADTGFVNSGRRRVNISLTEAEAAAVSATRQAYQIGDIVMVADAGGATTDINVLRLEEHSGHRTKLKGLTKAEGINVGSMLIDMEVRKKIAAQLSDRGVAGDVEELVWMAGDMMEECGFEALKCAFNGEWSPDDIHMHIPDRSGRIRRDLGSELILPSNYLKQVFDQLIERIFERINTQMVQLRDVSYLSHAEREVNYLVLSGGLGSSPYVQRRVKKQYSRLTVLCAPEPQLVVAKGLVIDRVQKLTKGQAVYTGKCCRVSYGVLVRQEYDSVRHRGEFITRDSLDGIRWAEEQVDWLIKEGEPVPETEFRRPYQLKVPKGEESIPFEAQFVMSESPAEYLPRSLKSDNVARVCKVTAHFSPSDFERSSAFKQRKRLIWSSKKDHWIAELDLAVIVGSTTLSFELFSRDGKRFSQSEAKLQVRWDEAELKAQSTGAKRTLYTPKRN